MTFFIIARYKCSYLLTYLLTYKDTNMKAYKTNAELKSSVNVRYRNKCSSFSSVRGSRYHIHISLLLKVHTVLQSGSYLLNYCG